MTIQLEVWGPYALFTRPEMKVERVSYDVMTPSAARGILDAVFWHPGMVWRVDRIVVMRPIKFANIRRNEVMDTISARNVESMILRPSRKNREKLAIYTSESIAQRSSIILKDVKYVIEAHFDMTPKAKDGDTPAKFISEFNRRANKGQYYHHPYFGTREFPAEFRLWHSNSGKPQGFEQGRRDLGYMLYDLDYSDCDNPQPVFFRAELLDGVLNTENVQVTA